MRYDFLIYLDDIVCRAVMQERGNSTARKTAMTTMSIMVVLLASLCRLSRLSLLNPNIDILLKLLQFRTVCWCTIVCLICSTEHRAGLLNSVVAGHGSTIIPRRSAYVHYALCICLVFFAFDMYPRYE